MAVSAISAESLSREQAVSFKDYLDTVPGAVGVESEPGETRLILRGISSGGLSSTAGIYIDETPYGSSSSNANGGFTTPDLDTFDMQRIEVLRGPQGTLYGANTLGGLVKFVTNAPDPSGFSALAEVGGEEIDHSDAYGGDIKGMVNIPLSDDLAFRVSGYTRYDPGYINAINPIDPALDRDGVNDVRTMGGRASLLWKPSDNFSVQVTAITQQQNMDGSSDVDLVMTSPTSLAVPFQYAYGPYEQGRVVNESYLTRVQIYNGTINWNLGWANLTSATSYNTFADGQIDDGYRSFFGNIADFHVGSNRFTQEVRLESPSDEKLEWLAGVYYDNEHGNNDLNVIGGLADGSVITLASNYKEIAGFGDLTYHFTPTLDLSVGGRWSSNDQNSVNDTFYLAPPHVAMGSASQGVFTWSVAPQWNVTDDTMLYARVAKGFRPGGPNVSPYVTTGLTIAPFFTADTLISYEIGAKSNFLDDRLESDVTLFYIDWSNIQVPVSVAGFSGTVNAGTAASKGLEWTLTARPIEGLVLTANGSYTDANYTEIGPPGTGVFDGTPLGNVPKWASALGAEYDWPVFADTTAYVGGMWKYNGKAFSNASGTIGTVPMPAYSTVDLHTGLMFSRYSLEIYVKNVGDTHAATFLATNFALFGGGVSFPGAGYSIIPTQPRTIGITLSAAL
jgi:outer membrane receptor protein involved in Fe transport